MISLSKNGADPLAETAINTLLHRVESDPMTTYEFLSICVSLIAAAAAATSLVRARAVQEKQLEFQAITAALAQKQLELLQRQEQAKDKADITVQLVKAGRTDFRFVLFNQGKAAAVNVTMRIAEKSPDNPLIESECKRKLPYPRLEPGQSFTLIAALHMQSSMRYPVHVEWESPDGSKESRDVQAIL